VSPRFLFFAGKGGVGKTTCAAARALVEARASARVLVVSTDPAHSLADAIGIPLGARPREVWRRSGRLRAVELDAPRAFARWLAANREALADVIEHGTWLDREDVNALLELSIPGVDELLGLIEIARLARADDATLVIVDTAPTGHTLQLFAAPGTVATLAGVLDVLQREHRLIRQQFSRVGKPEASDRLVALLGEQAREAAALLSDARASQLCWVLLPEELSVAESEDGLAAVGRQRIRVAEVIVNRVTPDGPSCRICDRRRREERRVIATLPRRLRPERPLRIVRAEMHEPRGIAALARIGRQLIGTPTRRAPMIRARVRDRGATNGRMPAMQLSAPEGAYSSPESLDAVRAARVLFFGGKGGVGKTTCAAATALRLARANARERLLLLSTDPAHSLGDVLGIDIGDRVRSIPGAARNLHAREMDARATLAARRTTLEAALDEIAAAFGAGAVATAGRAGLSELMDLAPPGVDELLAVLSVVEARHEYDLIIVDTAPTGHTLRLLEMPEMARDWVQALMRVLLKYRSLVRPGRLAAELVDLSKSIRGLHDLLRRPNDARFIVVTRAAELPRRETERLIDSLRVLQLATPALVLNAMTLDPGRCPRCRATAKAERVQLGSLVRARKRRTRDCAIILTPLAAPAPRGVAALERWARSWSSWSHTRGEPTSTVSSRAVARRL
jgi:arsenite-transporting ATPase